MSDKDTTQADNEMSLREFLETVPAGEPREVTGEFAWVNGIYRIKMPEVLLFCESETCQGMRLHKPNAKDIDIPSNILQFCRYNCKNCGIQRKIYALSFDAFAERAVAVRVAKLGEAPLFGLHIPPRVLRLVQPDAKLFQKGLRAESLGLGVGAFAYYRQIVEGQREHLLKEIKKVAARLNTPAEFLKEYDDAIAENQFAKSIERIKHGIPQSLLINDHNPLSLLHSALSQGIHAGTDEECLELAGDIRVILTELAGRISEALKDEKELTQAVNRLMQRKSSP